MKKRTLNELRQVKEYGWTPKPTEDVIKTFKQVEYDIQNEINIIISLNITSCGAGRQKLVTSYATKKNQFPNHDDNQSIFFWDCFPILVGRLQIFPAQEVSSLPLSSVF